MNFPINTKKVRTIYMAYSGKYKVKNPKKYAGDHTAVIFRSMWERHCFKWCDDNPNV